MFERVRGVVKHYPWGKPHASSLVASLSGSKETDKPHAELWFGTHPSGPLDTSKADLSLPYLFKVLSIARPLSIQVHPNKSQAELLHSRQPDHYPDSNQKLEAALALTRVRLLAGIKDAEEKFTELGLNYDLRTLLSLKPAEVKKYSARIKEKSEMFAPGCEDLLRAVPDDDVGIFAFLFMNYLELSPGESVLIKPGLLHAYLGGELLECMTTSDNVVRAGLTSKHKDVEALLDVLNPEEQVVKDQSSSEFFSLKCFDSQVSLDASKVPRVVLCLEGSAMLNGCRLETGTAYLTDESLVLEIDAGKVAIAGP